MKIIKLFLGLVLLVLVILVFVGGFLGFVPGLSNVLAQQRDLGVEIDPDYYNNLNDQLGVELVLSNSAAIPSYEGSVPFTGTFTGAQASSIVAGWESIYEYLKYVPFENVQIKVHEDGTVEMSAILNVDRGITIAKEMGYTNEQIESGLKYVQYMNNRIPFYAKGNAGIQEGRVFLEGEVLEIGRVKVPANILETVESGAAAITEDRLSQIPGLDVESIELKDSLIQVSAQIPEKVLLTE